MSTITIGVDLAKHVFSVCEMDDGGHVLRRAGCGLYSGPGLLHRLNKTDYGNAV